MHPDGARPCNPLQPETADGFNPCDGKWHLGAVAIDSSGVVRLYKDGARVRQDSGGSVSFSSYPLIIGSYDGVSRFFVGNMDESAIFNRTLSDSEILDIYELGIMKFNLSVRSCDDILCSGEAWINAYNDSMLSALYVSDSHYFQYKFDFETFNQSYSPILYNVTINYEIE